MVQGEKVNTNLYPANSLVSQLHNGAPSTERRGFHPAPLVQVDRLTKRYGTHTALDSVTLTLYQNEFLCIVGRSGCGKSTLLNCLAGLESYDGTIVAAGTVPGVKDRGIHPAMVFQSYALFPWLTVLGNVEFGLRYTDVPKVQWKERALAALELVGLRGWEEALPNQLSGGMMQRVAIARCIVLERRLLLMDEPFAAVDAVTREQLQDELLQIWSRTGTTIAFVTHSTTEALSLADRIVMMEGGRVVEIVNVQLQRPRNHAAKEFLQLEESISNWLHEVSATAKRTDWGGSPQSKKKWFNRLGKRGGR